MVDVQPYHQVEIELQSRVGRRSLAEMLAPRIWSEITQEVLEFLPTLPFAVLGSLDADGQPWASILCGRPGFLRPTPTALQIDALPHEGDPLHRNLAQGCDLGVIGIDFANRRRFRINGHGRLDGGVIRVEVKQCYRNCPQYIHIREARYDDHAAASTIDATSRSMNEIDAEAAHIISQADTFFIATHGCGKPAADFRLGSDVSHRGGNPGFVLLSDDHTRLAFPDYIGNFMFNTLGNLSRHPKCGLLFIDFSTGVTLQVIGRADVDWELARASVVPGAQRMIDVAIEKAILSHSGLPLAWRLIEPARDLRRYRTAPAAAPAPSQGSGDAGESEEGFTKVYVAKIVDEADRIRSFYLRPLTGGLKPHLPGQYLRILLPIAGAQTALVRHYSISNFDSTLSEYRLGVRRSDTDPSNSGSNWLHDNINVGDTLQISEPEGGFTLEPEGTRPIALVSIGSGVTPVLSMLYSLVQSGTSRDVLFLHGARSGAEQAYAAEVRRLADRLPNLKAHFRYSQPRDIDFLGRDHDSVGRLDEAFLCEMAPSDADFYLCGPVDFMLRSKTALLERGVPRERIRFEAFAAAQSTEPVSGLSGATVRFEQSGVELTWGQEHESILELAEAAGLVLEHSCRSGSCGTCEHQLVQGDVIYTTEPLFDVGIGRVLVCCSKPLSNIVIGAPTSGGDH